MASYKDIPKQYMPVSVLKLRYKGVWDMQDLYDGTISYLRDRKWKFHEKVYKHKHPSPFGVERQYVWMAEQDVDEYFKVYIDIYMHTYDAHDFEAMDSSGNKKIYTSGKVWATLKIRIPWDYHKHWDENSFWGALKTFYMNYILRKKVMTGYSPRYRHELVALYYFILHKLKAESRDFEYANIFRVHNRGL